MSLPAPRSQDDLPKQFLSSLRVLFNILDDGNTGFIRLADFESYWQEQQQQNDDDENEEGGVSIIPGLIENLRKITPRSGRLSFERFVAGLRISLQKNRPMTMSPSPGPERVVVSSAGSTDERRRPIVGVVSAGQPSHPGEPKPRTSSTISNNPYTQSGRPRSAKGRSPTRQRSQSESSPPRHPNTATVRPNVVQQQPTRHSSTSDVPNYSNEGEQRYRSEATFVLRGRPLSERNSDIPERNWQRDRAQSDNTGYRAATDDFVNNKPPGKKWSPSDILHRKVNNDVGYRIGESEQPAWGHQDQVPLRSYHSVPNAREPNSYPPAVPDDTRAPPGVKGTYRKVREPRRHTLQNGIDFNMVKKMKQLEQERDILLQGLESIDRARDWYNTQLQQISEKQKNISKNQHLDFSVEAHQERLNFRTARIFEVNQHLKSLVESSEKSFPIHMNLAVPQTGQEADDRYRYIREQNIQLTEDLTDRNERIAQLEKEKTSLIRELFEAKSRNLPITDDDTFM